MCKRLNISKNDLKQMIIMHDYQGKLIYSPKNENEYIDNCFNKISFNVSPDPKEEISNEINSSDNDSFSELCKASNNTFDSKISHSRIKPTDGVKITTNTGINEELSYGKIPNLQMSRKNYNKLCGFNKSILNKGNYKDKEDCTKRSQTKSSFELLNPYIDKSSSTNIFTNEKSLSKISVNRKQRNIKKITARPSMGSCSYFELTDEKPYSRRSIIIPKQKTRDNFRITRYSTRRSSGSPNTYHRLPPPPLGASLGHGILINNIKFPQ